MVVNSSVRALLVDSLKLVHDRQTYVGVLPVAGLERLVASLQGDSGRLDYQVRGDVDRSDRPLLKLRVSGSVQLQCQRCLESFEQPIDIDTAVRLVAAEALNAEYDDDPNEPDCVAASATFDLTSLIEDEVLLALPAYPRHEAGEERCTSRVGPIGEDGAGQAGEAGGKILAFSALKALKSKEK
jgi:uncharacterized protein